ncbi:alpha/beta fold hydrolase [Streptomyces sp. LE64]|uniref:alpha/beta fold hydrolase n=1 Tax=Streptomyces sp. LE64 TaxID=3448653 RepID=UPI004040EBE6
MNGVRGLAVQPETPVLVSRVRAGAGGDGPRLLLLHGLAAGSDTWDRLLPLLDPECEVWTAELPWRGSGTPEWWRTPPARWVREAVDAVPGGPTVLVAHSFGAGAALSWLDTAVTGAPEAGTGRWAPGPTGPGALRGVVLAAPFYRARAADFDWAALSYHLNRFEAILEEGVRVRSAGRLAADIRQRMAVKVRDRVGCHGWMRFFDTYLSTPDLRTPAMHLPFLLVSGSEDIAARTDDARALTARLPDAALHVLDGVGHFSMVERPGTFASLVNGLVRDLHDLTARKRPGPVPSPGAP